MKLIIKDDAGKEYEIYKMHLGEETLMPLAKDKDIFKNPVITLYVTPKEI